MRGVKLSHRIDRDPRSTITKGEPIMTATTITPAQLADELNTDPRTLRKFLRANARSNGVETPGKGSRWALDGSKRSIASYAKKFAAWDEARKAALEAKTDNEDNEVTEVESD